MAPEEVPPHIEEPLPEEEESSEETETGEGEGEKAGDDDASSNPSSKVIPGKISAKSQFSAQGQTVTGNPSAMPMMNNPINMRRHIAIAGAYMDSIMYGHVIFATIQPTDASYNFTYGYDQIASLTDETNDGITPTNSVSYGNHYYLSYAPGLISSTHATYRTVKVTFTSGYTRNFTILLPGTNQTLDYYWSTYVAFSPNMLTGPCDWLPGVHYNVGGVNGNIFYTVPHAIDQYIQVAPTSDNTNSSYYEGFWGTQISQGNTIPFEFDTATANSLVNDAFRRGSDAVSGTISSGDLITADKTNSGIQEWEGLIITADSNNIATPYNTTLYFLMGSMIYGPANATYNPGNFIGGTGPGLTTLKNVLTGSDWNMPFMHLYLYSENLTDCGQPVIVAACGDINSANYIGYDHDADGTFYEDCDGNAIPASIYNDATTTYDNSCCPDCTDFQLTVSKTDPTTMGGNDGSITLSVLDNNGLATGTANYTYVVSPQNNVDAGKGNNGIKDVWKSGTGSGYTNGTYTGVASTASASGTGATFDVTIAGNAITVIDVAHPGTGYAIGETITLATATVGSGSGQTITVNGLAGLKIGSGAVSNTGFTFGYDTDLAQDNVNTSADPTYATSSKIGYVPRVTTSGTSTKGLEQGTYKVFVFDSNSTASCLKQAEITLADPPPISGCTDTAAMNYNASANVSNDGACHYCDAADGLMKNGNNYLVGGNNGNIIANSNVTLSHNPISTVDETVQINLDVTPDGQYWSYVLEIVNTSGTPNAEATIEFYKWDTQNSSGNSNFGTLTGFNAGTTLVGSKIVNVAGNFNTTIDSSTIGATFRYGYYSAKVYVNDPDADPEVEQCYAIIDIIIPVTACEQYAGYAVATDGSGNNVIINDQNLYIHDPAICFLTNSFCCDNVTFNQDPSSPICARTYTATALCTDEPGTVAVTLQYLDNGNWVSIDPMFDEIILTPGLPNTYLHTFQESSFVNITGPGQYRVIYQSFYPNANPCTAVSPIIDVNPPIWGCTDPLAQNYKPNAQCDDSSCIQHIPGCTNPIALNYNPSATQDDGSCILPVYGCTDPTALNYDPNANTDDGSCIAVVSGCTDSTALNFDVNANTDDGSCLYCTNGNPIITETTVVNAGVDTSCVSKDNGSITIEVTTPLCGTNGKWTWAEANSAFTDTNQYSSGSSATASNLAVGNYTIIITDCYGCLTEKVVTVGSNSATCGCTDPAAENYDSTATLDDGSCLYCGCSDPNAINYDPNAYGTCQPNPCTYLTSPPPCIPRNIDVLLDKMKICIAESGFTYYNKLVTGLSDDCSILDSWKLILINYLLNKKGLPCIYNCSDANTPSASSSYTSCSDIWVTGGPSTGLNDSAVSGTGVGTTSTAAMFSTSGELFNKDVIKHHTSGNIWIFYGPTNTSNTPSGATSVVGLDPETLSGSMSGYWQYCSDTLRYTSNSYNVNYLDNFTNFVNTFCKDCGNTTNRQLRTSRANISAPSLRQGIDGIDDLEI